MGTGYNANYKGQFRTYAKLYEHIANRAAADYTIMRNMNEQLVLHAVHKGKLVQHTVPTYRIHNITDEMIEDIIGFINETE